MSELTLLSDVSFDTTSLSNIYIDEYMSSNNESQVKIYLYLLRHLSKGTPVSVITIADAFNYSVTDVERALFYMEKQGLMALKTDNDQIVGLRLLPLNKRRTDNFILMETKEAKQTKKEIVKPSYSAAEVKEFTKSDEIGELLFVVEAYLGVPLTTRDIKSIMFMVKELSFDTEMIDYLAEQCIENGTRSLVEMAKVAKNWYEEGVKSVEEAKALTNDVPKEVYEVFSAFKIKAGSRKPSVKESGFVKKWTKELKLDMSVIKEACEITVDKTHTVSFEYADAVLNDWHSKGVTTVKEAKELMENNRSNASYKLNTKAATNKKTNTKSGKSGSFTGRDYDFEQLEKELLSN